MLLTKDNLLRFIREKKAVTPTDVASAFETTTIIASAALSELSKDGLVKISSLHFGSTPFYYDPKQKEVLIDLAEKHLSGLYKEIFYKLKTEEILNYKNLTPQEKLVLSKLEDFAKPLEFEFKGKEYKFYVWYLRDLNETKKLIIDALKDLEKKDKDNNQKKEVKKENLKNVSLSSVNKENEIKIENVTDEESFVENYFREKGFVVESKNKFDKYLYYKLSWIVEGLKLDIKAYLFSKKISEIEFIKFYVKDNSIKLFFVKNPSKKLIKLSEELNNSFIISL